MTQPPPAGAAEDADRVASVGQRAVARAIDLLVVATASLAVLAPRLATDSDEISGFTQLLLFAIWVGYEAGTTAWLGQTMGKMAAGCRVVDRRTGARPGPVAAVVRAAVVPGLLPFLAAYALLGYATALLDRSEHRGLPDRLARTVVVKAAPVRR